VDHQTTNFVVLGLSVDFKSGVDMERVQEVIRLVEERYADQMLRFPKGQTKDILLTFMALGLADDLVQLQKEMEDIKVRMTSMLSQIKGLT
jgi:cell division protein ZapA